jgi:hypothetical protein
MLAAASSVAADRAAKSGSYRLLDGWHSPTCHAYQRFLDTTQTLEYQRTYLEEPKRSLECDRFVPPNLDLSQPSWTALPAAEHFELLMRVKEYLQVPLNEEATIPQFPYSANNPLSMGNLQTVRLELAKVDVDNDGTTDIVLRFRDDATCRPAAKFRTGGWSAPLIVLRSDLKGVDVRRTAPLMRNPDKEYIANFPTKKRAAELQRQGRYIDAPEVGRKPTDYAAGTTYFRSYDLFQFKGRTYFDRWVADPQSAEYRHLTVFRIEEGAPRKECDFVFKDADETK